MGNFLFDEMNMNTCLLLDNVDFSTYTDTQLAEMLEELQKKNEAILLENKLFESYYTRSNISANTSHSNFKTTPGTEDELAKLPAAYTPGYGATMGGRGPASANEADATGDPAQPGSRMKKKKGEKVKHVSEAVVLLTSEQKSEIATRELEELRDEVERGKAEWAKVVDNLKAEMEELEINISESKKDMFEFKRDIVQGALSERTGKVMAEKVLRYFEDKIRSRDTTLGKIRLKNSTLKTQKNKLMLQLKQKEEMGEVLHAIDFDQLKIENHQYLAKIEERNTQLLKLKMAAGNTVQVMNVFKKKLNDLTDESNRLRNEIHQRKELLEKLRADGKVVEKEKEKALQIHHEMMKSGQEFQVPSVMEYVLLKARQQNLQQQYRAWKRKVEIAQMSLGRTSRKLPSLHLPGPSKTPKGKYSIPTKDLENYIQAKSSTVEERMQSGHSQYRLAEAIPV